MKMLETFCLSGGLEAGFRTDQVCLYLWHHDPRNRVVDDAKSTVKNNHVVESADVHVH